MNITIRIRDELGAEIEKRRGDKSKAEFYREMIEAYLRSSEVKLSADEVSGSNEILTKDIADLRTELANKDNIIRIMNERVKDLQTHNGFLVSEFQRIMGINERLLPPPEPAKKQWWKFWKKQ